jgi:immune inhibitor A
MTISSNNNIINNIQCLSPPHPDIVKKFVNTKKLLGEGKQVTETENTMDLRTFSLLSMRPKNNVFNPSSLRDRNTGSLKALVILVDFENNQASKDKDHYKDLLFSSGTYPTGSMRDFFKESSYGALDITGDVIGWYRMPHPYDYYVNNNNGFGSYPQNTQKLIEDAVDAANRDVIYSEYDRDGDGYVDALFVVHAGPGAETSGRTDHIWSHRSTIIDRVLDEVKIRDYTCEAEDGKIGLFCHELTHVFGIPDLYDTDYSSRGIGQWCLMAFGSWNGGGDKPSHHSAWVKKTLGWVSPKNVTSNQNNVFLNNIENNKDMYILGINGSTDKEYFLLENRQKTCFDSGLPGNGVAIWHIDERQSTNKDERHYLVALEQADGKFDLEKNANSGDNGDLYKGTSNNNTFDDQSTPNNKSYSGLNSNISIKNIDDSSNITKFDIEINIP